MINNNFIIQKVNYFFFLTVHLQKIHFYLICILHKQSGFTKALLQVLISFSLHKSSLIQLETILLFRYKNFLHSQLL